MAQIILYWICSLKLKHNTKHIYDGSWGLNVQVVAQFADLDTEIKVFLDNLTFFNTSRLVLWANCGSAHKPPYFQTQYIWCDILHFIKLFFYSFREEATKICGLFFRSTLHKFCCIDLNHTHIFSGGQSNLSYDKEFVHVLKWFIWGDKFGNSI